MNADGSSQVRLTDTLWIDADTRIEWRPDGNKILFRGYNVGNCCPRKMWTINPDGTGLAEVYPGSGGEQGLDAIWSPAGDTVAYYSNHSGLGRVYRVAATGDSIGVPASFLSSTQNYPGWLPAGITFRAFPRSGYEWYLLGASGRHFRLFRGLSSDVRASWRR
jgi:Tol biopolymer transport system component